MGYFTMQEAADLDNWITGHYGEDDPNLQEPDDDYDPNDEEPDDFSEERAA